MTKKTVFDDLFVLDLANNHFGDVRHAKNIIDKFGKIRKKFNIKACLKFQFRNLDTFVHKNEIDNKKNKYVQRFLSTRLEFNDFKILKNFCKKNKFLTACTPFDEESIDEIEKIGFDYLKIASVSSNDWNLLERAAKNNIPKIISTGGKTLEEIDKIVSFFGHKKQNFSLMHCVALYPSKNSDMQLNTIKDLKERYKGINIGWSTHEEPENLLPSTIALSLGASMFEKHVGINSSKYKLNNYSTSPIQFERYLSNFFQTKLSLGSVQKVVDKNERKTLNLLDRGIFLRKDINKDSFLKREHVYFAFPKNKNQISASEISFKLDKVKLRKKLNKDKPLNFQDVKIYQRSNASMVSEFLHKVKAQLNYNKIDLGDDFDLEISHHYGLKNFEKYGCFLFNCINREYAKKIILMFPNQKHPLHKHKLKEETFQILQGKLHSELNGKKKILYPGDTQLVKPGVWHKFSAGNEGCIFEEVSTTHYNNDSFYEDVTINSLPREKRKSFFKNWGEHEIQLNVK